MAPPLKLDPNRLPVYEVVDDQMAEIFAAKSGVERLEIAFGMMRSARLLLDAHLRATHPDWTTEERSREIARRILSGDISP